MAQEVKLIEREDNYTNPFTLESQLKQVEGLWGRHGVFITSVANKIVDAIAWYNALWLLQWSALIFFFCTAKTETWGEKRNQNKEEEKGKEERATDNKGWTLIKENSREGGWGILGSMFFILNIFLLILMSCVLFPSLIKMKS